MATYLRLLKYVLPYWRKVVLLFITVTIFASLSGISLTLIQPFLRIVLYDNTQTEAVAPVDVDTPAASSETAGGIPLPAFVERMRDDGQRWFESHMYAGDARSRLNRLCIVLVLLFLTKNLFGYIQTYLTEYLEQTVLQRIRDRVYGHLQNLPLSYFEREKTGHILSRITNDVTAMRGAIVGAAASLIRNGLMTLIALVIVLMVSWKLSLLTFVIVPLNAVLVGMIGKKLKKRSFKTQEGMADVTAFIDENVSGMRVVKAFNMGDYERQRFEKLNLNYMRRYLRMKLWGAIASPTSELIGAASIIVILWYGGNLVLDGRLRPENLVLFIGAMAWVVTPVKNISKLNNLVQECQAAGARVFMLLDLKPEPIEETAGAPAASFERSIRFDRVSFEYVPGVPVLRDINLEVRPGEVVALVGPSGAGKSTMVDLIPRFYDPTGGRILFDGVEARELNLRSIRAMMGIVTQEVILFNDTVRNNIAYGLDDCPLERVVAAARAANADEFIRQLPNGYDTVIGERGTQLSGGQRQRISIARAILKDPQVLIFDEATSALDTQSEILVQEAIDRLLQGRTTFVIAHRLSTVQHADKILVMDEGVVREFGDHDQLMRADGLYKELYSLQFGLVS